mgnify:FL=1
MRIENKMNKDLLRKVQLVQLEIACEIKRVCEENQISFFLDAGTLIGAVRHQGFIPWDDDLDIGMLRKDYNRFVEIAPKALNEEYVWQSWTNDEHYALPFGKVRKRNTLYLEEKTQHLQHNGFYVDVFPFDYAPVDEGERKKLLKKRMDLSRCILIKENYKPWVENGKINWKKKAGYLWYQVIASRYSKSALVQEYENAVAEVAPSEWVYEQFGDSHIHYYRLEWLKETAKKIFENSEFPIPIGTDKFLREEYGDYMQLPPEEERENRHGIVRVEFHYQEN